MRSFSFSYLLTILALTACGPKDPPITDETGDMTTKTSSESTVSDSTTVTSGDTVAVTDTDSPDCSPVVLTACSEPLPDPSSSSSSTTVSTTVTTTFDCAVETA